MVWIDCEMTGLDINIDELVEVAVVITDYDLKPVDDGFSIVIKPDKSAFDNMSEFVIAMHTESGLIDELANGVTVAEAEYEVLEYILKYVPEHHSAPLAGNTIGTDRAFLAKYMTAGGFPPALPQRRRLVDQGARSPVVPARLLPGAGEERRPSGARRHPRIHPRTRVLPARGVRPTPRPEQRRGLDSGEGGGGAVGRARALESLSRFGDAWWV